MVITLSMKPTYRACRPSSSKRREKDASARVAVDAACRKAQPIIISTFLSRSVERIKPSDTHADRHLETPATAVSICSPTLR